MKPQIVLLVVELFRTEKFGGVPKGLIGHNDLSSTGRHTFTFQGLYQSCTDRKLLSSSENSTNVQYTALSISNANFD